MINLNENAEIFIPFNEEVNSAFLKTTHLAIGAHQDDVEIMAYHGIAECFGENDKWFSAIIVTNGAGSARDNIYKDYTDEMMMEVRKKEQKKAAYIGEYSSLVLLNHSSTEVKNPHDETIINEIMNLVIAMKPDVIYTHNLADKHDTHVGVVTKVIKALRLVPKHDRPKLLLGVEVWRDLDWVNDDQKVLLDVSKHPNLAASLVEIFDSQIIGGKRYDKATLGRRLANATFSSSHEVDTSSAITYALDLTKLMNSNVDIEEYIVSFIDDFKKSVIEKIRKVSQ